MLVRCQVAACCGAKIASQGALSESTPRALEVLSSSIPEP